MGKSLNGGILSNFEVYDIKIGIYSQLNDYMEIYMYYRSRLYFDLCLRSLEKKTGSQVNDTGPIVLRLFFSL